MDRMKRFFKYFLALLILYIIVDIACFYSLKSTYNNKAYSVEKPTILDVEVKEAKATFVNGYIKGVVTNNTNGAVTNKYLKVDAYSKRNVLLGTKYVKLKDLYIKEKAEFEASFNYQEVDHIDLDILDGEELPKGALDFGFDNPDDAKVTWLIIFGALILIA